MKVIPQSIDCIIPGQLYLSNLSAARSIETRATLGISHVLSICTDFTTCLDNDCHLTIPVNDTEYDDILTNLPSACAFIQSAIDAGGAVLVHCVMGISRSATVVAAYLMKTRKISRQASLSLIKQHRPIIHPNYSFLAQLDVFAQCSYAPSPSNPIYCAWKRSFRRTARRYIDFLNDTTEIIPGQILLANDFPRDQLQATSLLSDSGTTHVLTVCPSSDKQLASIAEATSSLSLTHLHIELTEQDSPKPSFDILCKSSTFIRGVMSLHKTSSDAAAKRGSRFGHHSQVLVYSPSETTACYVVSSTLLTLPPSPSFISTSPTSLSLQLKSTPPTTASVLSIIQSTLPLFEPSAAFKSHLDAFAAHHRVRQSPSPLPSPALYKIDTTTTTTTSNTRLPTPVSPTSKRNSLKSLPTSPSTTAPTLTTTACRHAERKTQHTRSTRSSSIDSTASGCSSCSSSSSSCTAMAVDGAMKVMESRFSTISIS